MINKDQVDNVIYYMFKNEPSGIPSYNKNKLTEYNNYQEFVDGWDDEQIIPTEQEIIDFYTELSTIKHIEYYKVENRQLVLDTTKQAELQEKIEAFYDDETKIKAKNENESIILNIDDLTSESQFSSLRFDAYKTEALANKTKKDGLSGKTMQQLIDIYNNLS